jgi:Cu2+-exporting ATPase
MGKPEFVLSAQPAQPPADHGQWIAMGDQAGLLAWFRVEDTLRPDAEALVSELQHAGMTCHVLSGDSSGHAEQVAQQLKIDRISSNASPNEKLAYIRKLQQQGAKVLMLGDGLNDAPVLAGADVSIAVAGSSDLATIAADGILLSQSLRPVHHVLNLVRKTYAIMRQNLAWAILYNITALPLAAAGYIPPWASALGMSASSLLVVINALRLNSNRET